jgi:predicted enzyme related to lactoylglutathione lyase
MAEAAAPEMTMPKHGEFCWTEIATNNLEACKSFYTNVFGWELKESKATSEDFEYQEFSANQANYPMGGMYEISKEMFGENAPPPHFMNYISVDNVDETTSKAYDLGAKIIKSPMEVPNIGKMSIIQDPAGGMIAFITLGGQFE